MAKEAEVTQDPEAGVDLIDQQPASPASTSSREETRDARVALKKTSIAGLQQASGSTSLETTNESNGSADLTNTESGRPRKKRSFEDLAKDNTETGPASTLPEPKRSDHKRVRSVDTSGGNYESTHSKLGANKPNVVEEESENHEETDIDAQKAPGGPGVLIEAPSEAEMVSSQREQVPTRKDESTNTNIPATSGFANTSNASPFGQPANSSTDSKSENTRTTSNSAFSSSGISAFASSEKSPFGAAAGSKSPLGTGGFGGASSTGGFGSAKSGFGSATGFASTSTSSFGGGSSGFGAPKAFGSTSGFGAPKPFGSTSAFGAGFGSGGSTFGAAKPIASASAAAEGEEEKETENEDDEDPASSAKDDAEQDPRFHQQQVDTGEEEEEIHFTSRARLYFFDGSWKERGTGVLKVNVRLTTAEDPDAAEREADPEADPEAGEAVTSRYRRKARLLMRADATHRVILNSPVFRGMRFGESDGSRPIGKIMHLQSLEGGKPVPLQIKIGKEEVLEDLYNRLLELEAEA